MVVEERVGDNLILVMGGELVFLLSEFEECPLLGPVLLVHDFFEFIVVLVDLFEGLRVALADHPGLLILPGLEWLKVGGCLVLGVFLEVVVLRRDGAQIRGGFGFWMLLLGAEPGGVILAQRAVGISLVAENAARVARGQALDGVSHFYVINVVIATGRDDSGYGPPVLGVEYGPVGFVGL